MVQNQHKNEHMCANGNKGIVIDVKDVFYLKTHVQRDPNQVIQFFRTLEDWWTFVYNIGTWRKNAEMVQVEPWRSLHGPKVLQSSTRPHQTTILKATCSTHVSRWISNICQDHQPSDTRPILAARATNLGSGFGANLLEQQLKTSQDVHHTTRPKRR